LKFDFPTSWHHGRGYASKTGDILRDLGCKQCLLLTDDSLLRLGVVAPVIASLVSCQIAYVLCGEVTAEPTLSFVEKLAGELDLTGCDSVVAVGGGSVIDVAKAVAILAQFGGRIRDFAGLNKVPAPLARKIVAVPTTAGTGSEISDGSALIDEAAQSKFLVLSTRICPAVAITDPELTRSMPPGVTANSGVDALTHAIESYVSRDASVATEVFSLRAIDLIGKGLITAYRHGDDLDARETVQVGATLAMVAGMNAHMGLCHAMVMPICALYHMPHGQACGMTLPHVLEFNAAACKSKVADIFKALGVMNKTASDDELKASHYRQFEALLQEVGVRAGLRAYGYRDDHLKTIVQETLASVQ
jgi:1,3-propanediol dehydrogenase